MLTRLPARRVLVTMALAILFAILVAIALWVRVGGGLPFGATGYRVDVRFPDGTGLVRGADVKISGVRVGKVLSVTPVGTQTDTELAIDPEFAPLPRDTRALLRNKSVLGERFVALSPGTATGPTVPEGGRLNADRVAVVPSIGDVLGTFDAPTRASIRRLTATLQETLRGRGTDLNAILAGGPTVTDELQALSAVVDRQDRTVARVLRQSGTVLDALAGSGADLRSVVADADTVAGDAAQRTDALRATVEGLPALMSETDATLRTARGVVREAAPVVARLRAGADVLPATLTTINRLVPELSLLAREARPSLVRIAAIVPDARALVDRLPELLPALRGVTRQMPPFFRLLEAYDDQLVAWSAKLGAMTQASTVGSGGRRQHYIKLAATIPVEPLLGLSTRQPFHRSNEYPAPGALNALKTGYLESFDCRQTSNPVTMPPLGGGSPPCKTQAPWTLNGKTAAWPRVEPLP